VFKNFVPIVNHSLQYNPSIDGLRGIAVLLVLIFHIWPEYFSFGYVGVDIFFVLSGFLITKIIYSKLENDSFSFLEFYRNRVRRIFPSMIIVVSFTLIVGYLFLFPSEFIKLGEHINSSSFFYQNFRLINETGYWDEATQLKPLLHFWSLSIEEQFYLFWPFLLLFLYKIKVKFVYSLSIVFIILFFIPILFDIDLFYHSFSRFWELCFGGIICLFSLNKNIINFISKYKNYVLFFFFISILISYQNIEFSTFRTFLIVLSSGLLILFLSNNQKNKFFSSKFLVFLGLISFPLYLWHYVLISYTHILGFSVEKYGLLIIITSIFLSFITYLYIELYFRKQKSYIFVLLLLFIALFLGFTGKYIKDHGGLENRKHLTTKGIYKKQFKRTSFKDKEGLILVNKLMMRKLPNKYIRSTTTNINAKFIVLIGDSHAHALYEGFSKTVKKKGYDTILLANSGCPPLIDGSTGKNRKQINSCKKQIEEIYLFIKKIPNLEKVIMVTRGPVYLENIGFGIVDGGNKKRNVYTEEYFNKNIENYNLKKSLYDSFEKTFSFFNNNDTDFTYILENPELGFHPKNCQIRPFSINSIDCKIKYNSYLGRMSEYKERIKNISKKYKNIKIFDPEKIFCDQEFCYAIKNRKMLYSDDDHLSIDGSFYLSNSIVNDSWDLKND